VLSDWRAPTDRGSSRVTTWGLAIRPTGWALLEKSGHSLLAVGCRGIRAHDFFGVGVGFGLVKIDLGVEGFLTDGEDKTAGFCDLAGKLARRFRQFLLRDNAIDQPPLKSRPGIDWFAGEQHFHGALAADGPGKGNHRSAAEQADQNTRSRELGVLGGDRQVTGSNQLAARRRGNSRDLRDDRLGDFLNTRHQFGADVENSAVVAEILPYHLTQVVPGGKDGAFAGDDDDFDFFVGGDIPQRPDERLHQVHRKRVTALGAVETQRGNGWRKFDEEVFGHGVFRISRRVVEIGARSGRLENLY